MFIVVTNVVGHEVYVNTAHILSITKSDKKATGCQIGFVKTALEEQYRVMEIREDLSEINRRLSLLGEM